MYNVTFDQLHPNLQAALMPGRTAMAQPRGLSISDVVMAPISIPTGLVTQGANAAIQQVQPGATPIPNITQAGTPGGMNGNSGQSATSSSKVPQGSYVDYGSYAVSNPELLPYTGPTSARIPPSPYTFAADRQILNLYKPGSAYETALSGDPNMENFNKAVVIPSQEQLVNSTLPMINSQYGNTPYGHSVYSGARDEAAGNAITDEANNIANARLNYQQQATQNMLNAASMLPQQAGVFQQQHNANQNQANADLNRQIQVWFENQGLNQTLFQDSMQSLGVNLQTQEFNANMSLQNQALQYQQAQIEAAKQASLYSTLGSVAGAGLGFATGAGPVGALIGSNIGGQIGNVAGGGTSSPAATTDLLSTMLLYNTINKPTGGTTGTTPNSNFAPSFPNLSSYGSSDGSISAPAGSPYGNWGMIPGAGGTGYDPFSGQYYGPQSLIF